MEIRQLTTTQGLVLTLRNVTGAITLARRHQLSLLGHVKAVTGLIRSTISRSTQMVAASTLETSLLITAISVITMTVWDVMAGMKLPQHLVLAQSHRLSAVLILLL